MLNQVDLNADEMRTGRWFKLGKTELKIAHVSNKIFKSAVAKYTADNQISVKDACKAMAEGLLVDWKELKHIDNSDVPYTAEMATYALLTNIELREFVESTASNLENFEG